MASVFLAYSSKDMRFVRKLRSELRRLSSHKIFVAEYNVRPGQDWRKQVEANLTKAEFFVPLVSKAFLESPEARRELSGATALADEKMLTIVPMIIEKLDGARLPLIVQATQYIRFQPMDGMIDVLLKALESSDDPLASKSALEEYVASRSLRPNQLVELAHQVYNSNWEKRAKSGAIKFIADRLRQVDGEKALELYDLIINNLYPRLEALRVARSKLRAQLGYFQEADDDCVFALENQPKNPHVLLQRFWVNHAWAVSKRTKLDARDQIATLKECLTALSKVPASTTKSFIGSYLLALAEGATLLTREYADTAMELVTSKEDVIMQINKRRHRQSAVETLGKLSRYYTDLGDSAAADRARIKKEQWEDHWHLY